MNKSNRRKFLKQVSLLGMAAVMPELLKAVPLPAQQPPLTFKNLTNIYNNYVYGNLEPTLLLMNVKNYEEFRELIWSLPALPVSDPHPFPREHISVRFFNADVCMDPTVPYGDVVVINENEPERPEYNGRAKLSEF